MIINAHTHIFNIHNLPKRFLRGYVPQKFLAVIAWPLLHTKLGVKLVRSILRKMKDPHLSKMGAFIQVGTHKSSKAVFKILTNEYQPGDRFVVLTLNMDHMGAGEAKKRFQQQLNEVERIMLHNPKTCMPFYSIDPRAGTADHILSEAKKYMAKGFVGLKMYPALGYYPFDAKLQPTLAWAEQNNIPIITHCNRGGSFYMGEILTQMLYPDNPYGPLPKHWLAAGFSDFPFPIHRDRKLPNEKFTDHFSEPRNYVPILEKHPQLKLCFAHAGGAEEMEESGKNWFVQIEYILKRYDNTYTDISYALYKESVHEMLIKLISDPAVKSRILFGTDFFMTLQEKSEKALVGDFKTALLKKKNGLSLWNNISHYNPKLFLNLP